MVIKNTLFDVNQDDLAFILKQIKIAEAEAAAVYGGAAAADALRAIIGPNAAILPFGLRHVDGSNNNLLASAAATPNALTGVVNGTSVGAADQILPRLAPPDFRNLASGDSIILGPGPAFANNNYGSFITGGTKSVVDTAPRTISNLIVDMTIDNPAAVAAWRTNPLTLDLWLAGPSITPDPLNPGAFLTNGAAFALDHPGKLPVGTPEGTVPGPFDLVVPVATFGPPDPITGLPVQLTNGITTLDLSHIPNQSPDIGLSPQFNGWMTFFGQFFDHGLDLITKGGNGTIYVPLKTDDLLYDKGLDGTAGTADDGAGHDGVFGTVDDRPNFMALTRSTPAINPLTGLPTETVNTTTPWVDQNQTYTSVASHQVFLRQYALNVSNSVDTHGHVAHAVSTGKLLSGSFGGIGTWADTKAQSASMLGIKLSDVDVFDVPLLVTDAYGRFVAGTGGFAQVAAAVTIKNSLGVTIGVVNYAIEGTAAGLDIHGALPLPPVGTGPGQFDPSTLPPGATFSTAFLTTGHPFLADIAHHAEPGLVDHDHNPATPKIQLVADTNVLDYNGDGVINATDLINIPDIVDPTVGVFHYGVVKDANGNGGIDLGDLADVNLDGVINAADLVADDRNPLTYDSEMLNAHFITGDGRGNENIGLTTAHTIFHSEHDRLVDANKATILNFANTFATPVEQAEHLAFLNQWLLVPVLAVPANTSTLVWDGERLFQAAKFTTEMEYQHLVFEEFARKVQPAVNPFVFTNSTDIDPAITAEFAHVVYRFGHSMLTDTVSRLDGSMSSNDIGLFDAFLNPQAFAASGVNAAEAAGNIIRGMSRQAGNEIDEFIVNDLRNRLVGLPLDLATLNLARGRAEGVPSLNNIRDTFFHDTNDPSLKAYISWVDYAEHLKNPLSIVNFIAAYGTHSSITSALTLADKRHAAELIVLGGVGAPVDSVDFLNSTGAWANNPANGHTITGLNDVDLWIGGLAEAKFEFGGMLGSTFNYVFERQMEHLQDGDRFYYLSRLQGLNLVNQLEANTFAALVQRNTTLGDDQSSHVSGLLFDTADQTYELHDAKYALAHPGTVNVQIGGDPVAATAIEQALRPPLTRWMPGDTNHDGAINAADGINVISGVIGDRNGDGQADGGYLHYLGGEHVVLGGTAGNDTLLGDKGIDTLWGDAGDDYLNAGMETDQVFGGDGDDIIYDPFGLDFLRGNDGNDVIAGGQGFKTMFGGAGNDFFAVGIDVAEIFAGPGNDFLLGGSDRDILSGNEGDDWIEGGEGFDDISGENSQLFFNSSIVGHDILNGQGNDTDYDAESGDDIMFEGGGIQRNNGMDGFDWAIHKGDLVAANSDLGIPVLGFGTLPDLIVRDRFDSVEGLSGWKLNDTLTGASKLILGENFDNRLTQEGVDRIAGLQTIVGGVHNADPRAVIFGQRTFVGDEIILGGDGNDLITGNLGDDIIDGDAWLNVRILIHANRDGTGPVIGTAESLTSKIYASIDAAGNPVGPALLGGKTLQQAMLARDLNNTNVDFTSTTLPLNPGLNPGQLEMKREILYDTTPLNNVDVAAFTGPLFTGAVQNYTITTDALTGRTTVVDSVAGRDGTDTLLNVEQLRFADGTFNLNGFPTGAVIVSSTAVGSLAQFTASTAGIMDLDGIPLGTVFNFQWQQSLDGGLTFTNVGTNNATFSTTAVQANQLVQVIVTYTDGALHTNTITSVPNGLLTGTNAADILTGGARDELILGLDSADVLNGGLGADTMVGGNGNDTYTVENAGDRVFELAGAGTGTDLVRTALASYVLEANVENLTLSGAGSHTATGNDLNNTLIGSIGSDSLFGGNGADIIYGLDGNDSLDGGLGNDNLLGGAGADVINGGDGIDYANYSTTTTAVQIDLNVAVQAVSVGDSSGDTLISIENVQGSRAGDTITGDGFSNILRGLEGNDTFTGGGGTDFIYGDLQTDTAIYSGVVTDYGFLYNGVSATVVDKRVGIHDGTDILQGVEIVRFSGVDFNLVTGTGLTQAVLTGGAGSDIIIANSATNSLTGGGGNDTFIFNSSTNTGNNATRDVITDFDSGDHISLSSIDANSAAGFQSFTFNSTGLAGAQQISFHIDGSNHTIIDGNVGGTTAAANASIDFQIDLGVLAFTLTAGDFNL